MYMIAVVVVEDYCVSRVDIARHRLRGAAESNLRYPFVACGHILDERVELRLVIWPTIYLRTRCCAREVRDMNHLGDHFELMSM